MQWYHYGMAAAGLFAVIAARKQPRALFWVAMLASSYIVSLGYLAGYGAIEAGNVLSVYTADGAADYVPLAREWLPPTIVAAMCDIVVGTMIRYFGRERWEVTWLAGAVFGMAALNIVYSSGVIFGFPPIPEQEVLGIALEAINLAALLLIVIGGTGIVDWITKRMGARGRRGHLLGRGLAYLREAKKHPLWR